MLLVADYKSGRGEEVDEGFIGWMKLDQEDESSYGNGGAGGVGRRGSMSMSTSKASSIAGGSDSHSMRSANGTAKDPMDGMKGGAALPLPQQPREVQVKGVRTCRECWAVVS